MVIYKSRNCVGLIASHKGLDKPRIYKSRKNRDELLAYPCKTQIFRSGFCVFLNTDAIKNIRPISIST